MSPIRFGGRWPIGVLEGDAGCDALFELLHGQLDCLTLFTNFILDELFLLGREFDADDLLFFLHGRGLVAEGLTKGSIYGQDDTDRP